MSEEDKLTNYIEKLQNMRHYDFNLENFYVPNNEKRYQEYLNDILFKYVTDLDNLKNHIVEGKMELPQVYAGLFMATNGLSCHIPERHNLFHEMLGIHEISHLIHCLNIGDYEYNKASEIIPYFNEYDYLYSINPAYAKLYEAYRFERANYAAQRIGEIHRSTANSHIYAYLVLENRKNDYNIDELNKVNATSDNIEKRLTKKKYTI